VSQALRRRRTAAAVTGLAAAATLAWGCGGAGALRTDVLRPAVLPVRVFPVVYVVVDEGDLDAVETERGIVEQLSRPPRVEVRRARPSELAAWRARRDGLPAEPEAAERAAPSTWPHGMAPVSCVIRISVRVEETIRPDWRMRPAPLCATGVCYPGGRGYGLDVLRMRMILRLRVEDGPTGRRLQEHVLQARDEGGDALSMRARLALELAARARRWVDATRVSQELPLVEVGDRRADLWLRRAREGRVAEARVALERLTRTPDFARRPPAARAALLHDVGQLVRADGRLGPGRHAKAVPWLERALALHAAPVHAAALRDARSAAAAEALLAEQTAARAHNAALLRRLSGAGVRAARPPADGGSGPPPVGPNSPDEATDRDAASSRALVPAEVPVPPPSYDEASLP
jgi:hypothetical protein